MDEAAPGPLADERTDLAEAEHVRHQIAARAGHLVDDHHLRTPDAGRRARERQTVAGDVVEVAVEVALQDVDDVVGGRSAAVVAFVDDDALLVLLREVVAVEARIARLSGVRQVDIGELAVGELFDQCDDSARPTRACAGSARWRPE